MAGDWRTARRSAAALVATVMGLSCLVPARAETLADALSSAYRANPQLSAERARQRADDENVPRALAGYRPDVSADLGFAPAFQRDRRGRVTGFSPASYSLTVNQPIYDGQRTTAAVRSAESNVFAGRETLRSVEQSILLSAATAYLDVIRDRAFIDLQKLNVELLEGVLKRSRKRLETGDVSRTDPAQAEARLQRGKADLLRAEAALIASRAAYRVAVGHEPGRLTDPGAPSGTPALAAVLRSGLEQHPDVRSATHAIDSATSDVRVAASELLPTISAQSSVAGELGRSTDPDQSPPSASLSAQVRIPIYTGGEVEARVRQLKETLAARRFELEASRDEIRQSGRSSLGVFEAARESSRAAWAAVAANEVALEGVRREALLGQRTTLDVLNAQQELVNARTALITARRDLLVAHYTVLAAAGRLSHRALKLRVSSYEPELHLTQVQDLLRGTLTPDGR